MKELEWFRTAIVNNNQDKASELLTNDARILEGGGVETKKEYLSNHFHSDGKILSVMDHKVTSRKIKSAQTTAWISTTSPMSGTYNNNELSINSAELAVLVKQEVNWNISAVHWFSKSAK